MITLLYIDQKMSIFREASRRKFPIDIANAMCEDAEFQLIMENGQVPRKEHFQRFLTNRPPLPEGYTWVDLKHKFRMIMRTKQRKLMREKS